MKKVESIHDVPDRIIESFLAAVDELRDKMIPANYTGDFAVNYVIVDRRKCEAFHYEPVPYSASQLRIKRGTPEAKAQNRERLKWLTANVNYANTALQAELSVLLLPDRNEI